MNMHRIAFLACLVLGPTLAACTAGAPPVATDNHERAIATLHTSRCGSCHTPPNPKTRTREYLENAFTRHRKRVRLTDEQWSEMTDYLAMPEGKTARQP
jgi:hypothetical protein